MMREKRYLWIVSGLLIILTSCGPGESAHKFTFIETQQGVEVQEDGQPVFFYQRVPKSSQGTYSYNHYIHPLYSPGGDTLTEEFPADHPYHRGVYWAWHQIYVDGASVGNGWTLTDIEQEVTRVTGRQSGKLGQLRASVLWKSPLFENSRPFLAEETSITVHARVDTYRIIDFTIALKALVPGVEIGGADNEKGYGGFCARIRHPELLSFTSGNGDVIPQKLQIKAGPWMDFSGPIGKNGETRGITLLCHPATPNYPVPWIIRNQPSMQNVVFPGRNLTAIPMDRGISLHYRLIIHDGDAQAIDIDKHESVYAQTSLE